MAKYIRCLYFVEKPKEDHIECDKEKSGLA
jgi:hypothetical protein